MTTIHGMLIGLTLVASACSIGEVPETADAGDEASSTTGELDGDASEASTSDTGANDAATGDPGDTTGLPPSTGTSIDADPSGTTGDMDTTGAGTTGTPDGGPVACPDLPGVLLCEDFEDGLDPTRWKQLVSADNHVLTSGGRSITGDRALRLNMSAQKGSDATLELMPDAGVLPVLGNHLFGRVFIFTNAVPNQHSLWVTALGKLDGGNAQYRLDSWGDARRWKATYAHPSIDQHGGLQKNSGTIPVARWFCLEWEFDGPGDALRFWFDGALEEALTVSGDEDPPWLAPTFTTLRIGHKSLQEPNNADQFDIWMDALVLSSERVGCG